VGVALFGMFIVFFYSFWYFVVRIRRHRKKFTFVIRDKFLVDLSEAISRKRCKIGGKSLLITNRKLHMGFPLVPNSVTLNDLKRRNRPNNCVISPNSVAFWADCVKVVEDIRILSATVM